MSTDIIFKINSFNVRGLRQQNKRLAIFRFLKTKHGGIHFIQETHSTPSDEEKWQKEWGGQIIFSHGTHNSKGVAILFPHNSNYSLTSKLVDNEGRFIIARGKLENQDLDLANIYAPTKDKSADQLAFLNILLSNLEQCSINTILGGDFNTCLENIDKSGGRIFASTQYTNLLKTFMEENDYIDIWRLTHPGAKRFTWRDSSHGSVIQSRLDFWLVPMHMLYNLSTTDIQCGILSDHSLISLSLKTSSTDSRGRGFWKFNCQLLSNNDYVRKIKECLASCRDKYKDMTDHGLKWDAIKMELRGASISFASFLARTERK